MLVKQIIFSNPYNTSCFTKITLFTGVVVIVLKGFWFDAVSALCYQRKRSDKESL